MSTSNIGQILLRNSDLLSANTPLFVNLQADGFIDQYLRDNPNTKISCYNTNFIDYHEITSQYAQLLTPHFDTVYTSDLKHDLVIINFPKCKDELAFTCAMIAPYLQQNTKIVLVGEKKGGVISSPKLTHEFLLNCQKIDAARHCLIFAGIVNPKYLDVPFIIDNWFKKYSLILDDIELTIASLPGVFSQKKLDVGTALLLQHLPETMQAKVLDFGCGAGIISCFIGKKFPDTQLSLLDVSALAITSARKTLILNGLTGDVFASNSLDKVTEKYQHIVSNPPFHQGTKTSYQASEDFLKGINKHIGHKGSITLVANSFLQYHPIMQTCIGPTQCVINKQGFSIYHCQVK